MSRNLAGRLRGGIEETIQTGPRVLVAFRPEQLSDAGNRLDDGIAYMVVSISDGKITELKRCGDRAAAAVTYAQTGEAPDPPAASGMQPP